MPFKCTIIFLSLAIIYWKFKITFSSLFNLYFDFFFFFGNDFFQGYLVLAEQLAHITELRLLSHRHPYLLIFSCGTLL